MYAHRRGFPCARSLVARGEGDAEGELDALLELAVERGDHDDRARLADARDVVRELEDEVGDELGQEGLQLVDPVEQPRQRQRSRLVSESMSGGARGHWEEEGERGLSTSVKG